MSAQKKQFSAIEGAAISMSGDDYAKYLKEAIDLPAADVRRAIRARLAQDESLGAESSAVLASITISGATRHLLSNGSIARRTTVVVKQGEEDAVTTEVRLRRARYAQDGVSALVKTIGSTKLRAGLIAVVGRGGVGKTPLAHAIAGHGGATYGLIRFGEPFAGYLTDPEELASSLLLAMATYPVVVLDSVKDLLSSSSGAAMKSGLNRGILPEMSSWAIAASDLGCALIVPVNPSSDDPEVTSLLVEALKSNVTSVLVSSTEGTWQLSSRNGESRMRSTGTINVTWQDGAPVIRGVEVDNKDHSARQFTAGLAGDDVSDNNDQLLRALHRNNSL